MLTAIANRTDTDIHLLTHLLSKTVRSKILRTTALIVGSKKWTADPNLAIYRMLTASTGLKAINTKRLVFTKN